MSEQIMGVGMAVLGLGIPAATFINKIVPKRVSAAPVPAPLDAAKMAREVAAILKTSLHDHDRCVVKFQSKEMAAAREALLIQRLDQVDHAIDRMESLIKQTLTLVQEGQHHAHKD